MDGVRIGLRLRQRTSWGPGHGEDPRESKTSGLRNRRSNEANSAGVGELGNTDVSREDFRRRTGLRVRSVAGSPERDNPDVPGVVGVSLR